MKAITVTLLFLTLAIPLTAQSYILGGSIGVGTVEKLEESRNNLDVKEFLAGWFLEDDTILTLRLGSLEPGSDKDDVSLDFNYYAVTVDYLFYDRMFATGFFAGPAYYDGDVYRRDPSSDSETVTGESEFGATAGVESMIPLSQRIHLLLQLSGHYLPFEEDSELALGITGGLSIQF